MAMSEHSTLPGETQATDREQIAHETGAPRTTEEIAQLLESLAQDQADLMLARRLRDWSQAVEQHGQYRLRADAASIQGELYKTLEDHLSEIKHSVSDLRDIVYDTHTIAQSNQLRHDTGDTARMELAGQITSLAATTEQIRGRLIELARDLAARPSLEETARIIAQVADHEQRITVLETGGEGG